MGSANPNSGETGPATLGSRTDHGTLSDALASLADNRITLSDLIKQIKARVGVVPFVGAGMSVPFGFPAWRPFLESQAPNRAVRHQIEKLLEYGQYEEAAERLLNDCGSGSQICGQRRKATVSRHQLDNTGWIYLAARTSAGRVARADWQIPFLTSVGTIRVS